MAWKSLTTTFSANSKQQIIQHNLGVIPDVIVVGSRKAPPSSGGVLNSGGYSRRLYDLCSETSETSFFSIPTVVSLGATAISVTPDASIEDNTESLIVSGCVRNCTDSSFEIGYSAYDYTGLISGLYNVTYLWNDGDINGGSTHSLYSRRMLGGYQIVDLQNTLLNQDTNKKIDGVYSLVNSTRKVIMFSGINIYGIELDNTLSSVVKIDGNYVANLYGNYLVIHEDDTITFSDSEVKQTNFIIDEEDF